MSDDASAEQPPIDESKLDPNIRQALNRTRETARERDEANARAAQLERKLAFMEAGIPTEEGQPGFLLAQAYQGPATAEAIKAEAEKYGIKPAAPPSQLQPDQNLEAELQAQRAIQAAGAGGTASSGAISLDDALRNATSVEEVQQIMAQVPIGLVKEAQRWGPLD